MALLVFALLATACVTFSAFRVQQALDARTAGDYEKAAHLLREEMKSPLAPNDATYVVSLHVLYIDVLAKWADRSGLEDWMDEAVRETYENGIALPGSTEDLSGLRWTLAKYYSFSGRNGLALPAMFEELERRRRLGHTYHEIKAMDGIASAYSDMGQIALATLQRAQMEELAARYFREPGVDPADAGEWLQYMGILQRRLDHLAKPGQLEDLRAQWYKIEPIVKQVVTPEFPSYAGYAGLLSVAGELGEARIVLAKAKVLAEKEGYQDSVDILCTEAIVETNSKNWEVADGLTRDCLSRWEEGGFAEDPVKLRIRAEVLEAKGEIRSARDLYARAADVADTSRESFSVADRAAFFSQRPIRAAIYGQIRSATRIAGTTGEAGDFLAAVSAAERMRARQLGDYLGADLESKLTVERLAEIRAALPRNSLVLSYVLMNEAFVVQAFDRSRFEGHVVPMSKDVPARLRTLASLLGAPDSSRSVIQQELVDLGRLFLGPVGNLLEGSGRLVVISDGTLNLIPFDLLVNPSTKKSLIDDDRVVQFSTSVRLLLPRTNDGKVASAGFFAAADPIYRDSYAAIETDGALIAESTRGLGIDPRRLFAPLPETRREVESIAELFSGEPVETLFGPDALESRMKSTSLSEFRYVHLATHGILGNEIPGVSEPAIVLGNEPGEDGLLLASEAMALELNADLTVLSACKTGSGELVTGEGVLGMSRAFLIAGSRAVVVSLWAVDSLSTEQLMVAFYSQLRRGVSPAEALRNAKWSVRSEGHASTSARGLREKSASGAIVGGRHPFFWSAFVMLGGLSEES